MNQLFTRGKTQGFTLVELMVTVLLLAIIATIATPFILSQLANMEAKRIRHTVTDILSIAKAESLIRRQEVIACLSDSSGRCDKNSSRSLLLFIDSNDNHHFDNGADILINRQHLDPKYATVCLHAGRRHYIKFASDTGKPRGHFGHIKYCPTSSYNKSKYQVSFSNLGRITYKPNNKHPTDCH